MFRRLFSMGLACCAYCWALILVWTCCTAMFCLLLPSCLGLFAVCFSFELASLLLGKSETATHRAGTVLSKDVQRRCLW